MLAEGIHEPIINEEDFYQVKKQLDGRYHPPYKKGGEIKNPLAGILFCKNCNHTMVRQPLKNKKYNQPVIICATAGCMMGSSLETTEKLFIEGLSYMLASLKSVPPEKTEKDILPDLTALAEGELSRLNQQMLKLYELLEQGIYDTDTFLKRRDEIRKRISESEEIIEKNRYKINKTETISKLDSVLEDYWELDAYSRNLLIKTVIKRAVYNKPKGSPWGALPEIEIEETR